jgi:hypothetical protein
MQMSSTKTMLAFVLFPLVTLTMWGCEVTPTTRATVCIRNHETWAPVQGARVSHIEGVMFKPGQASGEGTTGLDGCVTLDVGILDKVKLFIDPVDGPHYHCVLAHPRIDPSRTRAVLSPMFGVDGPMLEVVLTEIK